MAAAGLTRLAAAPPLNPGYSIWIWWDERRMSSLRSVYLSLIDETLRGGEKGYVPDFSNQTFGDFFIRGLEIDIDAPGYATDGSSNAKRLGCFLKKVDDGTAARTLRALWEYREAPAQWASPTAFRARPPSSRRSSHIAIALGPSRRCPQSGRNCCSLELTRPEVVPLSSKGLRIT